LWYAHSRKRSHHSKRQSVLFKRASGV